jgi:hypothetical protein
MNGSNGVKLRAVEQPVTNDVQALQKCHWKKRIFKYLYHRILVTEACCKRTFIIAWMILLKSEKPIRANASMNTRRLAASDYAVHRYAQALHLFLYSMPSYVLMTAGSCVRLWSARVPVPLGPGTSLLDAMLNWVEPCRIAPRRFSLHRRAARSILDRTKEQRWAFSMDSTSLFLYRHLTCSPRRVLNCHQKDKQTSELRPRSTLACNQTIVRQPRGMAAILGGQRQGRRRRSWSFGKCLENVVEEQGDLWQPEVLHAFCYHGFVPDMRLAWPLGMGQSAGFLNFFGWWGDFAARLEICEMRKVIAKSGYKMAGGPHVSICGQTHENSSCSAVGSAFVW